MKLLDAASLAVGAIDTLWSLADDFAPSATLREAAALAREMRESYFDQESNQQETLLKARIEALRQAHAAASKHAQAAGAVSAVDAASINRLQRRLDLLFSLLDVGTRERDVFAGNLGERGNAPPKGFAPLSEHTGAGAVVGAELRRAAESAFGTPRKQHERTERRARLEERLRVLAEMDSLMAEALPATANTAAALTQATTAVLDEQFDATRFALRAVDARFPGARPRRPRHASLTARAAATTVTKPVAQATEPHAAAVAPLSSASNKSGRRRIDIG